MKPKNQLVDRKYKRRQKAIALVIVLAMVSMMTIFMLAIFSVSKTEHTSSVKYADGQTAKELADTAVNVVMAQIWDGTQRTSANPALWASQPGAIRRYLPNGSFQSGYKLYSSAQMQVTGSERAMIEDTPATDWANMPERYADLNEPVIRPDQDGDGNPEIIYPVIDPRAFIPSAAGGVGGTNTEGFWYNTGFNGVVAATGLADLNARLPMPVEWVYVLKNGMMGTMSGTGGGGTFSFVPATGGAANQPSEDNPIVGRIAFWTDDETCKININTAGEPTTWAPPMFYHERDFDWAHYQPMSHEYQRYPGHPATVAMSSVLFPNQDLDLYDKVPGSGPYTRALQIKERIYDVMPKIHTGGSKAGTVAYWWAVDTNELGFGNLAKSVDLTASIRQRLYPSVDEFMFAQRMRGQRRVFQDDPSTFSSDGPVSIFQTPRDMERARFFLTAHSRSPEINMFGMPRVAIWPVADESLGPDYRTGFDNLIAFCSKLGTGNANSYYFRRMDSRSATTDINLPRNQQLLSMLGNILSSRVMPGGSTFAAKYDQGDATQILLQIFDYIRCTNLYDGFLAPTRQQMLGDGTQNGGDPKYRWETYAVNGPNEVHSDGTLYRRMPRDYKTYTADRISRWTTGRGITGNQKSERTLEYSFPGHGSVVPSQLGEFRGMGRFPCISEVGFQFICTADGDPDKGSFRMARRTPDGGFTKDPWPGFATARGIASAAGSNMFQGGRTAVKLDPQPVGVVGYGPGKERRSTQNGPMFLLNEPLFWYSNFPPFPPPGSYGTNPAAAANDPSHPSNHPGFRPENWNATLQRGVPLQPGQKRIQAMLNLELCVPAVGYGPVHPEFTIVIQNMQNLELNGQKMYDFSGSGRIIWKTGRELYHVTDDAGSLTSGGYIDGAVMVRDRRIKIVHLGLTADAGYDLSAGTSGDFYRGLRNFDLVSKFMTVDGTAPLTFSGAPIIIEIYAGHQISGAQPIQTYNIPSVGTVQLPMPQLVTLSMDRREVISLTSGQRTIQREIHAPMWWALNYGGALGRYVGNWPGNVTNTMGIVDNANPSRGETLGRFPAWNNDRVGLGAAPSAGSGGTPRGQSIVFGYDRASGNQNSPLLDPVNPGPDVGSEYTRTGLSDRKDTETGNDRDPRGTDVMISIVPRHGDIRHIMAKRNVPESDWMPHPLIEGMLSNTANPYYFAHNISRGNANANPGFDRGNPRFRLVPTNQTAANFTYAAARVPDLVSTPQSAALASKYGDFDNGVGQQRDGPWINKPDEGNTGLTWISQNNLTRRVPTAYFQEEDRASDAGESYMTPNRMISSPGMFGSLPSRVAGGEPWRTLLFRPHTPRLFATSPHPGGPGYANGVDPADHYIMDLFWMPVVEPYAISETFSSAGKINLNYQIVPFNHIRRSTGLHAAMKAEIFAAIPNADASRYLDRPPNPTGASLPAEAHRGDDQYHYWQPWSDVVGKSLTYASTGGNGIKHWYRKIEVEKRVGAAFAGTLSQFDSRFNFTANVVTPAGAFGLFRTASQICEIHLLPKRTEQVGSANVDGGDPTPQIPASVVEMIGQNGFWAERQLTGDNSRERPYANIYAKVTTQSNTFRVFYKAQVIRKARSVDPGLFDSGKDRITSEYRGSSLIERKLDPNNPALPDYANSPGAVPLDNFYRFRVLEQKRFAP